jgi:hypothetical protein
MDLFVVPTLSFRLLNGVNLHKPAFFSIDACRTENRRAPQPVVAHQAQIHGSGGSAAAEFGWATRMAPLRAKMASAERRSFFMIPFIKT